MRSIRCSRSLQGLVSATKGSAISATAWVLRHCVRRSTAVEGRRRDAAGRCRLSIREMAMHLIAEQPEPASIFLVAVDPEKPDRVPWQLLAVIGSADVEFLDPDVRG